MCGCDLYISNDIEHSVILLLNKLPTSFPHNIYLGCFYFEVTSKASMNVFVCAF